MPPSATSRQNGMHEVRLRPPAVRDRPDAAYREGDLQIIDVLEHPQLAEDEKILATPTLIKRLPPPLRRVIGDLSDTDKVLLGLDVWPDDAGSGGADE
jgi:hypothetical protein